MVDPVFHLLLQISYDASCECSIRKVRASKANASAKSASCGLVLRHALPAIYQRRESTD
jgi:hypothetical protein